MQQMPYELRSIVNGCQEKCEMWFAELVRPVNTMQMQQVRDVGWVLARDEWKEFGLGVTVNEGNEWK